MCGEVKRVGGSTQKSRFLQPARWLLYLGCSFFPELCTRTQSSERWEAGTYPTSDSPRPPSVPQASQLGVYRAFVDNYGVAMETAEKCCQANAQFAEISEVMSELCDDAAVQARVLLLPLGEQSRAD